MPVRPIPEGWAPHATQLVLDMYITLYWTIVEDRTATNTVYVFFRAFPFYMAF